MEVMLRQDVESLGRLGDVVDVAPGYARNYLLPKKLAIPVNEANLKAFESQREARRVRDMEERDRVELLAKKLEGYLCLIEVRATDRGHLFGSVTGEQIAAQLAEVGFEEVRPANVNLSRHIEEIGDYDVELILHPEVRAQINVRVAAIEAAAEA